MKYANQLTDKELKELYRIFTNTDAKIVDFTITKCNDSIALEGHIEIPEYEEEILKEDPNATLILDDDYEINDYNVSVFHHSGDCTSDYRKWMYQKFGNDYARDYLLGEM